MLSVNASVAHEPPFYRKGPVCVACAMISFFCAFCCGVLYNRVLFLQHVGDSIQRPKNVLGVINLPNMLTRKLDLRGFWFSKEDHPSWFQWGQLDAALSKRCVALWASSSGIV